MNIATANEGRVVEEFRVLVSRRTAPLSWILDIFFGMTSSVPSSWVESTVEVDFEIVDNVVIVLLNDSMLCRSGCNPVLYKDVAIPPTRNPVKKDESILVI